MSFCRTVTTRRCTRSTARRLLSAGLRATAATGQWRRTTTRTRSRPTPPPFLRTRAVRHRIVPVRRKAKRWTSSIRWPVKSYNYPRNDFDQQFSRSTSFSPPLHVTYNTCIVLEPRSQNISCLLCTNTLLYICSRYVIYTCFLLNKSFAYTYYYKSLNNNRWWYCVFESIKNAYCAKSS